MAKAEYKDRRYHIEAYDPEWPKQFEAEAKNLKYIFRDDAIAIEHVGSTAVPGMEGKPTIDILLLVNDLAGVERYGEAIARAGYEKLCDYVMPRSILLRRMRDNMLLSNVHILEKDHPHAHEMIALRDYLRSHPAEVASYSALKRELFQKYSEDYGAYRRLKDAYMADLKSRSTEVDR